MRTVRRSNAPQPFMTSRRLHAGGLYLRVERRSKTAGIKPAARRDNANIATNQGGSTW
jgi:hypothetical protein